MNAQEKEIFNLFIEESTEQIEKVEEGLLKLDQEYDEETLQEVFRMIHSLKGSALSMGFENMSDFAHDSESLLDRIRAKSIAFNKDIINLLFECLDKIKEFKEIIVQKGNDEVNVTETQKKIISIIGRKHIKKGGKNTLDEFKVTEYELLVMDDAAKKGENVFIIKVEIEKDATMRAMKAFLAINNLKGLGQALRIWPENYETVEDEEFGYQFKLILITSKPKDIIEKNIDVAGEIENIIIEKFEGKEVESKTIDIKVNDKLQDNMLFRPEKRDYIRVDIAKLDKLIGFVGELVIDNGRLTQITERLKSKFKGDPDIKDLLTTMGHVNYIGNELQESVMAVRVYTVENIFNRIQRMVRDLASRSDKKVNFITEGKNTELDRGILEEIVDPIVHLVRNAVDHGIESPEERIAKGKDPEGILEVRAKQQENNIIIEVNDDGKGIDFEAVKAKALEKNFISIDDVETMSEQQILNLIFLPGFSTAKVVTDISGRGVGMDVVKTNIEKINGLIEIETEKDKGCRFIIRLPLTLAIIQALLIKEGRINFAIPLTSVVETVRLTDSEIKEHIKKVKGKEVYVWRELVLPVIRLEKYYDIQNNPYDDRLFLIVVGFSNRYMCLIVDSLVGEQQVVIKNLGEYLGKGKVLGEVKGISGATILGDGSFAYVMDVPEILKELKEPKSE